MKTKVFVLLLLALSLLAGVAWAAPPPGLEIIRHVIGGGGGRVEAGSYALNYTIGQPVAGVNSAENYTLGAGFWGGGEAEAVLDYEVYLPLVVRE